MTSSVYEELQQENNRSRNWWNSVPTQDYFNGWKGVRLNRIKVRNAVTNWNLAQFVLFEEEKSSYIW